jgi:hypothetical protein
MSNLVYIPIVLYIIARLMYYGINHQALLKKSEVPLMAIGYFVDVFGTSLVLIAYGIVVVAWYDLCHLRV